MAEHTPAPSPGRSYYGFVVYLLGWSGIVTYLVWALVPHRYLVDLGLTYLPQPYWALALPSVLIMVLVVFVFLVYPGMNLLLATAPHDIRNITDNHSISKEDYSDVEEYGVPPVYDIPISQVCKELYNK